MGGFLSKAIVMIVMASDNKQNMFNCCIETHDEQNASFAALPLQNVLLAVFFWVDMILMRDC